MRNNVSDGGRHLGSTGKVVGISLNPDLTNFKLKKMLPQAAKVLLFVQQLKKLVFVLKINDVIS